MNKQQLANKIWESANKMRSKIEANEYKDYILGFIFYKFLSETEVARLKARDFADAQASRYRPGHILTAHNDLSVGKNRLYAYVLNLTREWRADWGGTLVFYGEDGHVEQGWVPSFNALNLFAVPMGHAVTQVGAHAATDRLSIVGWLRSHTPVGPQTREEAVAASARPVV